MGWMIDVNMERPPVSIEINRVGIVNVYVPIFSVRVGSRSALAMARVNAFINLPPDYKGIHASRNYESIMDIFTRYVGRRMRVEEICIGVARDLLDRHPYASSSDVLMKCLITLPERTPRTGKVSYERAYLYGRALARRGDDGTVEIVRKGVGVKVAGITACPSAQRTIYAEVARRVGVVADPPEAPRATHMQRAFARVMVEMGEQYEVDALKLIRIARESMSARTYELLKREDEAQVIIDALRRPRFAEDVVREMAKRIVEEYKSLPDDTLVYLYVRSLESIHQHDLVAVLRSTLGNLRRVI